MQSQENLLDFMFAKNETSSSAGFSMVRLNKACSEDLKVAACEALFLSFDSQLMDRENFARWLNDFSEDMIRLKYMDELDVLKNMAMPPAIKKLDHFLTLEDNNWK